MSTFKWVAAIGFFVLTLGAILDVTLGGIETGPTELVGHFWRATGSGDERIYFVTTRKRTELRTRGRPFFRTVVLRAYRLNQRDADGGSHHAFVSLRDREPVTVLGVAGGLIWLWQDRPEGCGLEGRDLDSLALRVGPEQIEAANPGFEGLLPNERKFVSVAEPPARLLIKTLDARRFTLELPSLRLRPFRPEELASLEPGQTRTTSTWDIPALPGPLATAVAQVAGHFGPVMLKGVRQGDSWWALLSDKELQKLHPSEHVRADLVYGDENRALHRIPLVADRSGRGPGLDIKRAEPLGSERFLKGGLLPRWAENFETLPVWVLKDPKSVLVMSQQNLGQDQTWRVTRLAFDGTPRWSARTGIAEVTHVMTGGANIIVSGFAESSNKTPRPQVVAYVDLANGDVAHTPLTDD